VPIRCARYIENLRVVELSGITICRTDAQRDSRLWWHGDTADLDCLGGDAIAELVRTFETEHFFNS
jgi:hypothetical protein